MQDLTEVLAAFKEDDPLAAIVIMDDEDAKRVAVAWPRISTRWRVKDKMPEDMNDRWDWLWKCTLPGRKVINPKLSEITGLPEAICDQKFEVLRANRLVYPDGTLSSWASKAIAADVLAKYGGVK